MYKIYHNDKLIYSPRSPNVTLGKAELTQQANCAGAIPNHYVPTKSGLQKCERNGKHHHCKRR